MRVAFHTYDLFPGREHLMPWRTLIEVAHKMIANNIKAEILTTGNTNKNQSYQFRGVDIIVVPKNKISLCEFINKQAYYAVFLPFTWRDSLKDLSPLKRIKCQKIAYFPGGVYSWQNVFKLIWLGGLSLSKPYILECISPKKHLSNKIIKLDILQSITFSFKTEKVLKLNGLNKVATILPGKDEFEEIIEENIVLKERDLLGQKYFLFMGAPAKIRGSQYLLKAFDKFASKITDSKIVFLMRTDVGSDYIKFENTFNSLQNKDKIVLVKETLTKSELKAFISNSYSVILPFIVIPSEIPLTFFEVLSCGIPIITNKNGGTTEYLAKAMLISKPGNERSLIKKMEQIWNNDNLRTELSLNAKLLMKEHPNWATVGNEWINCIKKS